MFEGLLVSLDSSDDSIKGHRKNNFCLCVVRGTEILMLLKGPIPENVLEGGTWQLIESHGKIKSR